MDRPDQQDQVVLKDLADLLKDQVDQEVTTDRKD
jgi:hypothetical protein